METRLRGLAISWLFAPYPGSADLDLFKRLKDTSIDYDVVQVRRSGGDERVFEYVTGARFHRREVPVDHLNPRTRRTRDEFLAAVISRFKQRPDSYDFLLSHSNEVPSHRAALEVKRLSPGLPWIAYFGDLVSKNPYLKHIGDYPLADEDNETEALTLRHADLVICNNEYQKRLMFSGALEQYAGKAVVIPHCFDPAMYPRDTGPENVRFTFVHLGTLYHVKRTAEPLLKAIDRLIEVYPEYKNTFEVLFHGGPYYPDDLRAHAFMRCRTHVRLEEPVPYLESLRVMRRADALILIDAIFDEEGDGLRFNPFFPGKLADYMGAQKPIIGVTMPEGPTADILRESGNLLADSRTDRIAYVLKRHLDRKVRVNFAAFSQYECKAIAARMEQAIRATVASSRALRKSA